MPLRIDYGSLGSAEITPQGGIKAPAHLTRTGVFSYKDPSGKTIREYRPPSEVFHIDALESLRNAPVTLTHPKELKVNTRNFKALSAGHVSTDVRQDSDKVAATLFIQDQRAIDAVRAGIREVSCGYHCDTEDVPGVSPEGEAYDRIQRNIRNNHVALVPNGRAGSDIRLRLDSAGNSLSEDTQEIEMHKERIDGVDYDVGTDAHKAACTRREDAEKVRNDAVSAAAAKLDVEKARADAAEVELATLKLELAPAKLDERVASRTAVCEKARTVLGKDFKLDGLDELAIKTEAAKKAFPALEPKFQSGGPAYVAALFDGIDAVKTPAPRNDAADKLRQAVTPLPTDDKAKTPAQVRCDAQEHDNNRWQQPLAISCQSGMSNMTSNPSLQTAQLETMK